MKAVYKREFVVNGRKFDKVNGYSNEFYTEPADFTLGKEYTVFGNPNKEFHLITDSGTIHYFEGNREEVPDDSFWVYNFFDLVEEDVDA